MENEITRAPLDDIEIIELDERLDMAVDPLLGMSPQVNGACGAGCTNNILCGGGCS